MNPRLGEIEGRSGVMKRQLGDWLENSKKSQPIDLYGDIYFLLVH
jgi:hypothetical protein